MSTQNLHPDSNQMDGQQAQRLWWHWFTRPHPQVIESGNQLQAQLLLAISITFAFTNLFGSLGSIQANTGGTNNSVFILSGTAFFAFVAAILSRQRNYTIGSYILLVSLTFAVLGQLILGTDNITLTLYTFLPLNFVLGIALLPFFGALVIFLLNLVVVFLAPIILSVPFDTEFIVVAGTLITLALLSLITLAYRNRVERERLNTLIQTNLELEAFQENLEQRVVERTRALKASAEVSRSLSTILDTDQLVHEVVNQIQETFGIYHAHIYLVDEENDRLVMAGGTGEAGKRMLEQGHAIVMGRGLVGRAAITATAVFVPDVSQDPAWLPNSLLPETRVEAALPIVLRGQVLGVLDVQHNETGVIDESTIELLESIANQVAIALQNARQIQGTLESEARTRAVLESVTVPMFISRVSDGQMLYVNEHLANVVGMTLAELQTTGKHDFYVNATDRQTVVDHIQQQGFVSNYELLSQRADGNQFWALLSARLINFAGQPSVITTLIDINDRKQAEATLAKQANALAAVAEVGTAAATILQPELLLQEVVDLTKERFGLYHAHVFLLDENKEILSLISGAGDVGRQMVAEGRRIPLGAQGSLVATAARSRQPIIRSYDSGGEGFMPHPLLWDTRTEMAIPITLGEALLGVLDVRATRVGYFEESDKQTFMSLATQIAVALQNARSFTEADEAVNRLNQLTRRLTRTGWQDFAAKSGKRMAFGYQQERVTNLLGKKNGDITAGATLVQPLELQGEKIGALVVSEPTELAGEAREILTSVADRLSEHLENLRLSQQTQEALAQTETLYAGSAMIIQATTLEEVLTAITTSTALQQMERSSILFFDRPWEENPEEIIVKAGWSQPGTQATLPPGTSFPLAQYPIMKLLKEDTPVIIEDIASNETVGSKLRELFATQKINSIVGLPLTVGNRWFGIITAQSERVIPSFAEDDIRQIRSLVEQAASVLRTQQLLEDIQNQANLEQTLREVTARVYAAPTAEAVLRTAAREANRILGLETFVYVDTPAPVHETGPLRGLKPK